MACIALPGPPSRYRGRPVPAASGSKEALPCPAAPRRHLPQPCSAARTSDVVGSASCARRMQRSGPGILVTLLAVKAHAHGTPRMCCRCCWACSSCSRCTVLGRSTSVMASNSCSSSHLHVHVNARLSAGAPAGPTHCQSRFTDNGHTPVLAGRDNRWPPRDCARLQQPRPSPVATVPAPLSIAAEGLGLGEHVEIRQGNTGR